MRRAAADATDAELDPDGDTLDSLREYWAGTHPNLGSSAPFALDVSPVSTNQTRFEWSSTLIGKYRGWYSTNLNGWTQVFDNVVGEPPKNLLILTNAPAATGFFRVEAVQP